VSHDLRRIQDSAAAARRDYVSEMSCTEVNDLMAFAEGTSMSDCGSPPRTKAILASPVIISVVQLSATA